VNEQRFCSNGARCWPSFLAAFHMQKRTPGV
jgi:hypothetical protein